MTLEQKAFSGACRVGLVQHEDALGLEQFSLALSMEPRTQNERWQRGFALDPIYETIPAAPVPCGCFTVEGA